MDSHRSAYDPPSSAAAQSRGSTSQMCLNRILTTIATAPPPSPAPLLAAIPSLFAPESEKPSAGDGAARVRKCTRFDFNSPEAKESLSSSGDTCDVDHDDRGGDRAERRLCMLIEAAELIFGEFEDGDKSELKNDVAVEVGGELEETPPSPVVRSKRGRTRVLPCRYRDSVVEPLNRFTQTGSAALPSSPVKRRRR